MDEPPLEISGLGEKPEPDADLRHRYPAVELRVASYRRRALASASLLAVVALLASVWLPLATAGSSSLGSASPTLPPTFTAVPLGPTPTPILVPTPVPVVGLLSTPPANCPAGPSLDTLQLAALGGFSGPVQMRGGAPVWAVAGYLPQGLVEVSPAASGPNWPYTQIMWEIGPYRYPSVTVRALDLETGTTAWWGLSANTPQVPLLVMNPTRDYPTAISWVPYRTLLFITLAGCYKLQVSWAGGTWYTIFAAGQTSVGMVSSS